MPGLSPVVGAAINRGMGQEIFPRQNEPDVMGYRPPTCPNPCFAVGIFLTSSPLQLDSRRESSALPLLNDPALMARLGGDGTDAGALDCAGLVISASP